MSKMKYLVIHTTDTPYNREVTKGDIELWHLMPLKNSDGTYTYKGKKYASKDALPNEKINGVSIKNQSGRGWKVVGYSDLIQRSGEIINLNPYNFDEVIDSKEVTNGATGYNSNSRHVVLAGGWSKDGKTKNGKDIKGNYLLPEELYTKEQIDSLIEYIEMQKEIVKDLKVIGHNEVSQKTCPNFDVQQFLKKNNLL